MSAISRACRSAPRVLLRQCASRFATVSAPVSASLPVSRLSRRTYATALDTANLLKKSGSQGAYKAIPKRFWESANVQTTEDGHQINLGTRPVKTSSGNPLVVPHNKTALAHLIVQEWATLPNLQIKPHSLPLTSIAARAIDIQKMPTQAEVDDVRNAICKALLPYVDTDTMLIFAPSHEYDGRLRAEQEERYRPIIEWAETHLFNGNKLSYMDGDKGLTGNPQTEEIRNLALEYMLGLSHWELTAFERAVLGGKSFLGGIKLVRKELTTSELAELVSLENIHQMRRWGEVEDSHDVDWADLRRQLGSAAVLLITD
ncbi:hypothetical protein BZA70DRAFT_259692 [Myxozyma melibiosi]|uniref:ATP synthase mitochondrial F1 complex assembly factor 2 n=1 Tax=Myxozyma melibiosi TaxID=54550 RepID=A0ABR1F245_9ASCO